MKKTGKLKGMVVSTCGGCLFGDNERLDDRDLTPEERQRSTDSLCSQCITRSVGVFSSRRAREAAVLALGKPEWQKEAREVRAKQTYHPRMKLPSVCCQCGSVMCFCSGVVRNQRK